jgi:hypothetical protein
MQALQPPIVILSTLPTAGGRYSMGAASTLRYEFKTGRPIERTLPSDNRVHAAALDWIALGREVLPGTRPMSQVEKESINAFFLSHFE